LLIACSRQLTGSRPYQEDAVAICQIPDIDPVHGGEWLLALADGMGGHAGGDIAGTLATQSFCEIYPTQDRPVDVALRSILETITHRIGERIRQDLSLMEMGTTLIAAVIKASSLHWISVGDSPLWLYRHHVLQRLNEDHSMLPVLKDLVEIGRMTEAELAGDPRKHHLRSVLTDTPPPIVSQCSEPLALQENDLLILASDGVESIEESELAAILKQSWGKPLEEQAERIMERVVRAENPQQDNASLVLSRYQPGA